MDLGWRVVWMYLAHNISPADTRSIATAHIWVYNKAVVLSNGGRWTKASHKWTQETARRLWASRTAEADCCLSRYIPPCAQGEMFGVLLYSSLTISKTLKFMGRTRQWMHNDASQHSDTLRCWCGWTRVVMRTTNFSSMLSIKSTGIWNG